MTSKSEKTQKLPVPILVVIPCLNEATHIDGLIDALLAQIADSGSKIVVADGGSTDGTVKKILKWTKDSDDVIYLNNPKKIQSAAVNLAVSQFGQDFEYWVRIDAHASYPSDFLFQLADDALKIDCDSVVVPMETVGKTPKQKAIAAAQNSRLGNGGSAHRLAGNFEGKYVDHGHHALMRVKAFLSVEGYDESFSHNEDAELDMRLGKKGYKIWLTGQTSMIYYPRSEFTPLMRQYFGYGRGRARTTLKHKVPLKARQLIPAMHLPLSVLILFAPIWPILSIPFLLWVLMICIFSVPAARNAQGPMNVKMFILVLVSAGTMHVAWSAGFCWSFLNNLFDSNAAPRTQKETP